MGKRKTTEEFIEDAIKVHGDKYDYSKVDYKISNKNVEIVCKEHGSFLQLPLHHTRGHGCRRCHNNGIYDTEQFIDKAKTIHGNKYDYSFSLYKSTSENLIINCKENNHGLFNITPNNHISGKKGCPRCGNKKTSKARQENPTGWSHTNWQKAAKRSKHFDSFKVYILECTDPNTEEHFYKIGKTFTTIAHRFRTKNTMSYSYSTLKIYYFNNAQKCSEFEKALQNKNKEFKYKPLKKFNGMYECFSKIK